MKNFMLKIYSTVFSFFYSLNGILPTWIPIKLQYWISTGVWIDFDNPIGYAQKIQWIKAFYRNPLYIKCSDKYTVREYVEKKGFGHLLPDLLGVYDAPSQIDFSKLPDSFVLKISTGSGSNFFISSKENIDVDNIISCLEKNMMAKQRTSSGETHYLYSKRKIICEKYLSQEDYLPADYKFYCCDGKVLAINYGPQRPVNNNCKMYIVDMQLNDISAEKTLDGIEFVAPVHFDDMIYAAKELSKGFPFVRVDFYETESGFYFSELTFTPSGGTNKYLSKEADLWLGEQIELPTDYYSRIGKWVY